jgi:hypothetical protein
MDHSQPKRFTKPRLYIFIGAAGVILGLAGVLVLHFVFPPALIPKEYVQKALFPLYMPTRWPAGFTVDATSYQMRDGALIFIARNDDGRTINVTEQAKPTDFDFAGFYSLRLNQARTLANVPYQSVWGGIIPDGKTTMLSTLTDSSWLIITSSSRFSETEYRQLVQSLRRQ